LPIGDGTLTAWPAPLAVDRRPNGREAFGEPVIAPLRKPSHRQNAGSQLDNLPHNLRELRKERKLTLDELSVRCGVSRAMISKIERGVSIPTATVLGKLAAGLEIGLSRLLGGQLQRQAMLVTPGEQPVFKDPDSGLERRSLSPLFSDRSVDFVLNTLPPGRRVVFPPHHDGVEEYLYVAKGRLQVTASGKAFEVGSGSMLFYQANAEHEFRNLGDEPAEFFIVIDSTAAK
jgi:transcriptional regulator with XRE-family HTH domain